MNGSMNIDPLFSGSRGLRPQRDSVVSKPFVDPSHFHGNTFCARRLAYTPRAIPSVCPSSSSPCLKPRHFSFLLSYFLLHSLDHGPWERLALALQPELVSSIGLHPSVKQLKSLFEIGSRVLERLFLDRAFAPPICPSLFCG
jgi:hypothetical protein